MRLKIKAEHAIPFQIEPGDPRKLTWMVATGTGSAGEKHMYELVKGRPDQNDGNKGFSK